MADIFISYARHDKALVAPLVAALESEGWSVWWDPEIVPGQAFDDRIAEEIDKASAVVVVWTPASVASRWVRGEAREAADRSILVPVRFGSARLPIDARAVHTIDLDDWKEDRQSPPFKSLSRALSGPVAHAHKGSGAARFRHSHSVERAHPTLAAISRSGTPSAFSRRISRILRMDNLAWATVDLPFRQKGRR